VVKVDYCYISFIQVISSQSTGNSWHLLVVPVIFFPRSCLCDWFVAYIYLVFCSILFLFNIIGDDLNKLKMLVC
jgi:hypothetical protein